MRLTDEDAQMSGTTHRLHVVKGAARPKAFKRSARAEDTVRPPDFRLIDCRPNLYDCLASGAKSDSLWRRFKNMLRDWLFLIAAKLGRESSNDNDP